MHVNPCCYPSKTCRIWGQPCCLPSHGRGSGHSKYSCSPSLPFFSSASRKAVTYLLSKLFCYVRVIQSNYVMLIVKAFSCSVLGVGLEQQGQADGREIMVTPEIWDTMHSLLLWLLNWMLLSCIISMLLERKFLHSLKCLQCSVPL